MSIKRVSNDFIDLFPALSVEKRRDNFDLHLNEKPSKRLQKEIELLFLSFGGVKKDRGFTYEFTYDPKGLLEYSVHYGYVPLAHMNYAFIPTQIMRTMNSYLAVLPDASVYYPFYGYGNFGSRHDDFYKFINIDTCIGDFSTPIHDIHRDEYQYDAIFMRPQLSGNLAWAAIRDNTKFLKSSGKLITILDSKYAMTSIFNNFMSDNYVNVVCYRIPELTWTPVQYQNHIYSFLVYGEKR